MAAEGFDQEERARLWHRRRLELGCDSAEPWAHGMVLRASQLPDYWGFNLVMVEGEPDLGVAELIAVADRALGDLAHRRVDFEDIAAGEARRSEFEALGWQAERLLYLRYDGPPPAEPELEAEEVDYDDVNHLRRRWNEEDFPGRDQGAYREQARALAMASDVQVLGACRDGEIVAFAQLQRVDGSAEIDMVYVDPDHRGDGLGTAITRAAIGAAGPVDDLWIAADDEDRPKRLYQRLGFLPVRTSLELTRLP